MAYDRSTATWRYAILKIETITAHSRSGLSGPRDNHGSGHGKSETERNPLIPLPRVWLSLNYDSRKSHHTVLTFANS
jgi:hypothetical protein